MGPGSSQWNFLLFLPPEVHQLRVAGHLQYGIEPSGLGKFTVELSFISAPRGTSTSGGPSCALEFGPNLQHGIGPSGSGKFIVELSFIPAPRGPSTSGSRSS